MLVRVMNWVSRHILLAPFMCLFLLFGSCGSSHKSGKFSYISKFHIIISCKLIVYIVMCFYQETN